MIIMTKTELMQYLKKECVGMDKETMDAIWRGVRAKGMDGLSIKKFDQVMKSAFNKLVMTNVKGV